MYASTDHVQGLSARCRHVRGSRGVDRPVRGWLPPVARQAGAVFAIDGRVAGLELFDSLETCRKLLPKIVRSYAVDAIDRGRPDRTLIDAHRIHAAAEKFMSDLASSEVSSAPAVGLGTDVRITGTSLTGRGACR